MTYVIVEEEKSLARDQKWDSDVVMCACMRVSLPVSLRVCVIIGVILMLE